MLNSFTWANFSQRPENIYEFELSMVEHSLGVGDTMRFLLTQPEVTSLPQFELLIEHFMLIIAGADKHDLSKFMQTPEFVKRYYPAEVKTQMSRPVFKYYGWDIRANPDALTKEQIQEAKNAFKNLNKIDHTLVGELVLHYSQERGLSEEVTTQLLKEFHAFEQLADLLNRKMFENISRFRRNITHNNPQNEVFEFGRPVQILSDDPHHWNNNPDTPLLAARFFHSPTLKKIIANIDPYRVVDTYLKATKNSPFIKNPEQAALRDKTINEYIENRLNMRALETRAVFGTKKSKQMEFSCRIFYKGI
jgi:hypothetical protein